MDEYFETYEENGSLTEFSYNDSLDTYYSSDEEYSR